MTDHKSTATQQICVHTAIIGAARVHASISNKIVHDFDQSHYYRAIVK